MMPVLSVKLFDRFQATLNEASLGCFRTRKVQALLIYLLVEEALYNQHVIHAREALMALLWPDSPGLRAQGNLRQTLFHLRRAIPEIRGRLESNTARQPLLLSDRSTVQLNPLATYCLDVSTFLEQIRSVEDHNHANLARCNSCQERLKAAVTLYQGDFLSTFSLPGCNPFEEWSLVTRERLRSQALEALHILTRAQLRRGDYEEAQRNALQQVAIDSLRETAYQQLMESLARRGLKCEALIQYRKCSEILARELRVHPTAETKALAEHIRSGGMDPKSDIYSFIIQELPPIKPSTLRFPQGQVTPLVDREEELAHLTTLILDSGVSLVALNGLDGYGKTRLALAFAENQLANTVGDAAPFPDGIIFVPLHGLGQSNLVIQKVGEATLAGQTPDVRFGQPASIDHEFVLNQLQYKRSLLILDSYEPGELQTALLHRIQQAAAHLKIILTSRERPCVPGAHFLLLEGLRYPDNLPQPLPPLPECLARFPAVALFRQRARLVQPDFELNASNLHHIGQICQSVGGMPLAIELAADWLRVASPARIAGEIRRNLRLLQSDEFSESGQHRCVRTILGEIWGQLDQPERLFLARVSIFGKGFTRNETISVIGSTRGPRFSFPLLRGLVDKSILKYDPSKDRYYIPELLRRFTVESMAQEAMLAKPGE